MVVYITSYEWDRTKNSLIVLFFHWYFCAPGGITVKRQVVKDLEDVFIFIIMSEKKVVCAQKRDGTTGC